MLLAEEGGDVEGSVAIPVWFGGVGTFFEEPSGNMGMAVEGGCGEWGRAVLGVDAVNVGSVGHEFFDALQITVVNGGFDVLPELVGVPGKVGFAFNLFAF